MTKSMDTKPYFINIGIICDRVRENQPYVGKNIVFRRISERYRLMDLRCKFGVDCLLPARDIATFICAILKIKIPKTAISRNEMFPYTRSVTRNGSPGRV